jgi:hypothetical protein
MKSRNPKFGCVRIAQQISLAFSFEIDKDVVRRVLAKHYRPGDGKSRGPSWLTLIAQSKDSLWSVDLFCCESILLRSYWVLVVMDVFTRRNHRFWHRTRAHRRRDRVSDVQSSCCSPIEVDAALVGTNETLRYDPGAPVSRGIELWHEGKFVARVTPLDAYANCFVRRHRPSQGLDPDTPAPAPRNTGLVFRDLVPRTPIPDQERD